ncbi:hypothetical protein KIF24_05435 [Micromonospora sp. Llam7]|uniref:hypothetical protein n=1 Tax=Micromonospora tarapacensis TaxID=2835305 RepID=UPI001C82B5A1|nr:hypothetical protein [Micromonospora tarapacensis]MBX7265540.1 hypothetical protein [Micromonospora tarapacensis]
MRLRFLGKESTPSNSPTLYASDKDSYIVQGWIVTDPDVLARLDVSDSETVVEVPARLLGFLALDGMEGDVTNRVPPIVHVLDSGNYIIQGERVGDTEALGQMTIPDYETCVEVPKAAMQALLIGA